MHRSRIRSTNSDFSTRSENPIPRAGHGRDDQQHGQRVLQEGRVRHGAGDVGAGDPDQGEEAGPPGHGRTISNMASLYCSKGEFDRPASNRAYNTATLALLSMRMLSR